MEFTKEKVLNELNRIFVNECVFTHEDEFNLYFKNGIEFLKVRKIDSALHYRFNEKVEWLYDQDLFEIEIENDQY